jgi:hypothetical protein
MWTGATVHPLQWRRGGADVPHLLAITSSILVRSSFDLPTVIWQRLIRSSTAARLRGILSDDWTALRSGAGVRESVADGG